ncbi:MAG: LysR family transcriptional regulator, partial [Candidatus Rokuibacteriota bacterium]
SEAAQANGISQSAVSQLVLQLEKRLGVVLVDRSRRPLQLTREGKAYYDGCKRLVDEYLAVEATVRSLNARMAATIHVAAIYSVGLRDMSQYVQRFVAQHPNVEIDIEYLHPDRVYEKVQDGTADFGLVSFPRGSRKLTALPWREEEMVVTCAPTHALASRRGLAVADLAGQKYVGFDRDLVIRKKVDRFLRDRGATVDVVLEFDNIENIKDAIEISAGVALLPQPALQREIQAGTLAAVPLTDSRLARPLGIIHRRNPKPSAMTHRLIELLRQPDEAALPAKGPVSGIFASGNKVSSPLASRGSGS